MIQRFPEKTAIHSEPKREMHMKKMIVCALICFLLIAMFFIGKSVGSMESADPAIEATLPVESTDRNLRISVTPRTNAGFTAIPLEQGNYKNIQYLGVENVIIDIDGIAMRLEDALQNGHISVDEMIAYARQDAALGLCRETAKSENGLTEFTFRYPEFRLRYIYDLYETPNNGKRLITDFLIYGPGNEPRFLPADGETGEPIDYEDWGLRFEISSLDLSGITIKCSQSGGQQMGKLNIGGVMLLRKDPNTLALERVQPLTEEGEIVPFTGIQQWSPDPDGFLTMGGTKEVSFDFLRLFGKLTAGDYVISLQIVDWYEEEEVPPLMRNFHDEQWYDIEFTIE